MAKAKFSQANFLVVVVGLIRDLTEAFGRDDPAFLDEFCFPCLGNAAHESGGFALMDEQAPTVAGSLGGLSFFQWTGMGKSGRRKAFMDHCAKHDLHPYSYQAAVSFLIYELRNTETSTIRKTRAARVLPNTPAPKNILMARVVAFELAFERAGTKHYPSRYQWAVRAQEAYNGWVARGRPSLPGFVPPKGALDAQFRAKWGAPPIGPIVIGAGGAFSVRSPAADPTPQISAEVVKVEPTDDGDALDITTRVDADLPAAGLAPGGWPEDRLSPEAIKQIQSYLRSLGWLMVGKVDGSWGDLTVGAIKAYQTAAGVKPDGHWGPETLEALKRGITYTPPPARAEATSAKLRAVGDVTATTTHQSKIITGLGALGGLGTTLISAISDYFGDAMDRVKDLAGTFNTVPAWVWGLAVVVICLALYLNARRVEKVRVADERTGANLSLAEPLPASAPDPAGLPPWHGFEPEQAQAVAELAPAPGILTRGGHRPGVRYGDAA